jgi:hypothetical protein
MEQFLGLLRKDVGGGNHLEFELFGESRLMQLLGCRGVGWKRKNGTI